MRILLEASNVIRRLGSHTQSRILFGYDRYLVPELDEYRGVMRGFGGELVETVDSPLHYLTSAEQLCRQLQPDDVGILCCGTGIGMSIAANKFRGVYAARCSSIEDAELARTINNANVVCLAANRGFALNRAIIHKFIETAYTGRKLEELEYIVELEGATSAMSDRVRRIA